LHFHAVAIVLLVLSWFNWFVWPVAILSFKILPKEVRKLSLLYAFIILVPYQPALPKTCEVRAQTEFASVCVNQAHVRINQSFPVGSVIELKGYERPPTPPVLVGFQRDRYYKAQGIHYEWVNQGSVVIETRQSVFQVRDLFLDYLSTFEPTSQAYVKALLAGDRSMFEQEFLDDLSSLGILHLFAISGLHVGLMVKLLESGLNKAVKRPTPYIILFLFTYFFVTGFATSVVRAGLMWIFYRLLKPYGYQSLDAISLAAGVVLLHNPYAIFDVGFQLSYLVSLGLLLVPIQGSLAKQLFVVSLVAQAMTLPIVANLSRSVNVLAPFINVVFVWFVSVLLVPFSLVELVWSNPIYQEIVTMFELMLSIAKELEWQVALPFVSPLMMIGYYGLLFVKREKPWFVLWLLIVLLWPQEERITFIDVGQGDAVVMQLPHCTLLLDTGGQLYRDIDRQVLRPHFHALGITHIDKLVLTHGDFDHVGAAYSLLGSMSIGEVVLPQFSQHQRITELATLAQDANIPVRYVKHGDRLCRQIDVLGPTAPSSKSNDESIVMRLRFDHKHWLFMGDNEQMVGVKADVYMLGHHGSKTSTNQENLSVIQPSVGVISVGRNNYGLPSPEVLALVEELTLYRTDQDGTILYSSWHRRFFTTSDYRRWFYGER
jgi:competence protein ComEC